MNELPVRRVVWVLLVYGLAAGLLLPAVRWLRRVLALPPLFETLAHVGLAIGVPMAAAIAWYYPRLGSNPIEGGDARPEDR